MDIYARIEKELSRLVKFCKICIKYYNVAERVTADDVLRPKGNVESFRVENIEFLCVNFFTSYFQKIYQTCAVEVY